MWLANTKQPLRTFLCVLWRQKKPICALTSSLTQRRVSNPMELIYKSSGLWGGKKLSQLQINFWDLRYLCIHVYGEKKGSRKLDWKVFILICISLGEAGRGSMSPHTGQDWRPRGMDNSKLLLLSWDSCHNSLSNCSYLNFTKLAVLQQKRYIWTCKGILTKQKYSNITCTWSLNST